MDLLLAQSLALALAYAAAALLAVACRRELGRLVPRAARRELACLVLLALAVRALVPPRHVEAFESEHIFLSMGRSLAIDHRAGFCILGRTGACERYRPYYPGGYPFAVGALMALSGASPAAGSAASVAAGALAVAAVHALVLALGRSRREALLAALLLAFLPLHVRYSAVAHTEAWALLLESCAALAASLAARSPSRRTALLLGATLAVAAQSRIESALVLPLALALGWALGAPARGLAEAAAASVTLLVPFLLGFGEYLFHPWEPNVPSSVLGTMFVLDASFIASRAPFLLAWADGVLQPALLLALLAAGLGRLLRSGPRARRLGLVLAAWLGVKLALYVAHSMALFQPRVLVNLYLPAVVLGGCGLGGLSRGRGERSLVVAAALASGLAGLTAAVHASPVYRVPPALALVQWGLPWLLLAVLAARRGRLGLAAAAVLALPVAAGLHAAGVAGVPPQYPGRLEFTRDFLALVQPYLGEGCLLVTEDPFYEGFMFRGQVLEPRLEDEVLAAARERRCLLYHRRSTVPAASLEERLAFVPLPPALSTRAYGAQPEEEDGLYAVVGVRGGPV